MVTHELVASTVKAHASSVATQDNFYWYDGLQQVTRHDRGDLTPGSGPPYTGIDPSTRQQMEVFTFDETGNWPGYFSQSPSLTQSRTHNPSNQITSISGPTGAVQPAYDPAGNMTRMPRPGDWSAAAELTWDAWNRLVKLRTPSSPSSSSSGSSSSASSSSDSSSSASGSSSSSGSASSSGSGSSSSGSPASLEITFQYDALTRRTRKTNGAGTIDYYYDRQWRAVEERTAGTVTAQYVWSPLDRWTMIRRKRSVAGTLDETRYVLKDYLDPAAVIDTSAAVVERFGFDAFGPVRFMDAAFAPRAASTTGWNFLFHAEFLDADSGLYNYGYRYYHPELGRWISRDPIGEDGGLNLYAYVGNNGINWNDILGGKKSANAKGTCKVEVCCRPVAIFTRAHCVIKITDRNGKISGCRGGPSGSGNPSGEGGSSGSSNFGPGNNPSSHCKGCCGSWGNIIAGCGEKKKNPNGPLEEGINNDLEDAELNPGKCQTIDDSESACQLKSCLQKEMEKITKMCYIYHPDEPNSNTAWYQALKACGHDHNPPGAQPGRTDDFSKQRRCNQ